jgi:hypothetical protein
MKDLRPRPKSQRNQARERSARNDDGSLTGEGRGENLVRMAPGKPFDYWVQQLPHSKYLTFEVVGE